MVALIFVMMSWLKVLLIVCSIEVLIVLVMFSSKLTIVLLKSTNSFSITFWIDFSISTLTTSVKSFEIESFKLIERDSLRLLKSDISKDSTKVALSSSMNVVSKYAFSAISSASMSMVPLGEQLGVGGQ